MIRTQFAPRPSLAPKAPVRVVKPVKPVHTVRQASTAAPAAPAKPEIKFEKDAVAPFSPAIKWWQEPDAPSPFKKIIQNLRKAK
jgi:hypothetical protein